MKVSFVYFILLIINVHAFAEETIKQSTNQLKIGSHRSNLRITYEGAGMRTQTSYQNILFNDYTYYAKDIAKMKDEPFVNNQKNSITSINHELVYTNNMSANAIKYLTKTWKDVALNFYKNDNFGDELERIRYFEDDIDQLLANHAEDVAKIQAIFNHVRSRIKCNGNKRLYSFDKLKRVCENGKANSADINLMLTSMLRYAGLNEGQYNIKLKNNLDVEITDYEKENINKTYQPVLETFSFLKANGFYQVNDKIYFSLLTFLPTKENPFKQDRKERNFTYPRLQRIMINVDIPDNYKIEYLPEATALELPENAGKFVYNISQENYANVQIVIQKEINQPIFEAEFHQTLKQFYTKVVEKETYKIALTKTRYM